MSKEMTLSDAIKVLASNAERLSEASARFVKKDGTLDTDALAVFASRGDALEIIANRTSFSGDVPEPTKTNPDPQSARDVFCDHLFNLASEMVAGVEKQKTGYRISVPTPSGRLTIVVD